MLISSFDSSRQTIFTDPLLKCHCNVNHFRHFWQFKITSSNERQCFKMKHEKLYLQTLPNIGNLCGKIMNIVLTVCMYYLVSRHQCTLNILPNLHNTHIQNLDIIFKLTLGIIYTKSNSINLLLKRISIPNMKVQLKC